MVYFAPDGGSSWCTFTPLNIETSNPVYVGTRYLYAANSWHWSSIPGNWTAFWMYECDGQMWISHRQSAAAYFIMSFGASFISARATHVDYNEAQTEVGIPSVFTKSAGMTSSTSLTTNLFSNSANLVFWWNSSGTTKTAAWSSPPFSSDTGTPGINNALAFYNTTSSSAIFKPYTLYTNVGGQTAAVTNIVVRGAFQGAGMQTRTTVKDGSGVNTLGYSWYPDDAASATANVNLMFMNTP
jgi:hypothetical protein